MANASLHQSPHGFAQQGWHSELKKSPNGHKSVIRTAKHFFFCRFLVFRYSTFTFIGGTCRYFAQHVLIILFPIWMISHLYSRAVMHSSCHSRDRWSSGVHPTGRFFCTGNECQSLPHTLSSERQPRSRSPPLSEAGKTLLKEWEK